MTSTEISAIEAYSGGNSSRLSRLEMLQQQHQFNMAASSPSCEHECNCVHHHHHSSSNFSSPNVSNGPYAHHHNHFNHLNQHMHPNSNNSYIQQDGNLIYNNSSSSECNQATNDSSQSGCSGTMMHYAPTSNLSALNIIPSCECVVGHIQHHHHQRQSSTEQSQSIQSGRSSRVISCDENNPSGTDDGGSGMSNSGMIITTTSSNATCRLTSKRLLNNLDNNQQRLRSPKRQSGTSSATTKVNENDVKGGNQDDNKYSNAMDRMDIYSDSNENAIKTGDEITEDDRPPRLPPRPPPRPRNTMSSETVPHNPSIRKYVIWCLICGGVLCLIGVMFLAVYFLLRSYTSTVGYFETVPPFVPSTLLLLTGLCVMSLARRRNRYSYLIKLSGACSLASALTCALVTVTTTVIHMSRLQALRECQYTQKTRTCTCSSTLSESDDGSDIGGSVRFVFDATTDCSVVHGALYSCLRAVFGLSVAGVFVSVFSCMLVYQLLSHERKKMYWEQLELRCRSLYSGPPLPPPGPAIIGTPGSAPCRCCEQCHAHRAAMPTAYTWDSDNRFWAGQAGNFYSPNPGDEVTGGNNQRNRSWNWPRMPWQRNADPQPQTTPNQPAPTQRFGQHHPSSSDSQYGFTNSGNPDASSQQNGYSVIAPYGVHWGPPPPYSDPNSPARRGRYQYIHASTCHQNIIEQHIPQQSPQIHHEHNSSSATEPEQTQMQQQRNGIKRVTQFKTKENYENAPSDSDGPPRISNTLPTRKTKKHVGSSAINKSIGPNNNPPRANVQNVFNNQQADSNNHSEMSENEYNEPSSHPCQVESSSTPQHHAIKNINVIDINNRRMKLGIENTGFQPIDAVEQTTPNGNNLELGESEVYFADVSSCCNIYEDANQRSRVIMKSDKMEADEYLSQRFGNREPSTTRSRLPFPQVMEVGKGVVPAPRTSLIQKEISRQSMCSIDSSEKTDFTDLSPATPTVGPSDSFVASFPSYNELSSQEAHRRSTKNLQDILSSPYETIKDDMTLNNNYELNHDISSSSISSSSYNKSSPIHHNNNYSHSATPTKSSSSVMSSSSNATPIKRSNPLGTNISAIIQNLSGNDIGLLYPENNAMALSSPHHHQHKQKQDCNNDVINRNIVVNSEKEWQSSELNGNDRRM